MIHYRISHNLKALNKLLLQTPVASSRAKWKIGLKIDFYLTYISSGACEYWILFSYLKSAETYYT